MKWTEGQSKAIEDRGQNILVSAAAGSGKTAVLVERIKQLIIVDNIPIDKILVVTFTNAAATEMKEKIIKALNKEIIETSSKERRALLKSQLDNIYKASISTFHAFAINILREYFYLIDIDPNFSICDEATGKIMQAEAMEETFLNLYEREETWFLDFLDKYSGGKGDSMLKENLISLYKEVLSMPEPLDWLKKRVEDLKVTYEEFEQSSVGASLKEQIGLNLQMSIKDFEKAGEILETHGVESLFEKNESDIEVIENILNDGISESYNKIENISLARMVAKKEEKEIYDEIKDLVSTYRDRGKDRIKSLKEKYFAFTLKETISDMNESSISGEALYKILFEFHNTFMNNKREEKLVDFSDVEHFAIKILSDEKAAETYNNKFEFIFIDEYQDSNGLQEKIIDAVKRDNNVFMVGDIKQSIYRFRLANPDIFWNKYKKYKEGLDESSKKIDLNVNFRSKEGVISTVNNVFKNIMADYNKEDYLYKGITEDGSLEHKTEFCIVDKNAEGIAADIDQLVKMKSLELEAMAAAKLIKESLGRDIYDCKEGRKRPLQKKDIVVLMRGLRVAGTIFYDVFMENQLETYLDDNSGYFDTIEIITLLDLLKVVDNEKNDISLLGVLNSSIFRFTIDELIEIRSVYKQDSFFDSFLNYADEGSDKELKAKINDTLDTIRLWRRKSTYMPLEDFVWHLIMDSGYYNYISSLPGGEQRQANLNAFIEKTIFFKQRGDSTIYGLLKYIEAIGDRKVEVSQTKIVSENHDSIKIMTIHKSKGLEFPMVIVAGLRRRFNSDKSKKIGIIHKDIGFGLNLVNKKAHWHKKTLIQHLIEDVKKIEALEEEIRILYVAFTRAMDKLVLLGAVDNWEKQKPKAEIGGENNYFNIIYPWISQCEAIEERVISLGDLAEEEISKGEKKDYVKSLFQEAKLSKDFEDIDEIFSFKYKYQEDLKIKSKYSVSELNEEEGSGEVLLKAPSFATENEEYKGLEIGTIMHTVLEHLDFKEAYKKLSKGGDDEYIRASVGNLVKKEILTDEEAEKVNYRSIRTFILSNLGQRISSVERIKKEKPFTIVHEYKGREVMVQGIIDCYFEEEDGLVLIDYKTNSDIDSVREKYKKQINLYKEALEKSLNKKVKEAYLYMLSTGESVKM